MTIIFEEHPSDSPFIDMMWRSYAERSGPFISLAATHWTMVVSKLGGKMALTVRGPETRATPAYCPPDVEFFAIYLRFGAFMPHLPVDTLVDGELTLPEASGNAFWLHGSAWQFPTLENADVFVDRLARAGLLVREPVVDATLQGHPQDLSLRSVQRRFLRATGLTGGAVHQIERARYATALLQQGVSILDTVMMAGYADQPHLTRSLKRLIGQTPAQIIAGNKTLGYARWFGLTQTEQMFLNPMSG